MTAACGNKAKYTESAQFRDGSFHNATAPKQIGWRRTLGLWWQFMFKDTAITVPVPPLEVTPLTRSQLEQAPDGSVYRLGHSTVLLKLNDAYWLTDPVFSERASPVQWAGPKRFIAPPITLEELPPLTAVILSHDHFDHLDRQTVIALAAKTRLFIAPLGVGDHLVRWGIPAEKIKQLDWWQTLDVRGVRFIATPAQHFSGRRLFVTNPTLWASWVIKTERHSIFFSGDTGYFAGFAEIGERHGPFDLTLLEAGAYDPQWEGVHMLPEQVLQAHRDLRGEWLLPIHNVTFDLAFHAWDEPFERLVALASQHDVRLTIPRIGEPVQIGHCQPPEAWWRVNASKPDALTRERSAPGESRHHLASGFVMSPPAEAPRPPLY
jgi:L-ascorbate metabolism protein UlaG (beta-lactamase superfamily)